MKLLFDENVSERSAALVQDLYPGSVHVVQVELLVMAIAAPEG